MSTWLNIGAAAVITGITAFWIITDPNAPISDKQVSQLTGNTQRGEQLFNIGGCLSCHASKPTENDSDSVKLAGGNALKPNLEPLSHQIFRLIKKLELALGVKRSSPMQ
ncbi:hypothetical protein O1D97_08280 [Marinomonas sp. 15G1-11]|uniref:Cytochrome c domain-containing protein n=1 Tax=Marinomonas phaeophyticola TaxID=3004091 RepID=A0ABT4JTS7_9GAMM|nr:hypothetical protein [Marinomonas sp. 15G1-11]MCZ2721651.1 hypothetical protein [Marinomonas sp. 15G1-11]